MPFASSLRGASTHYRAGLINVLLPLACFGIVAGVGLLIHLERNGILPNAEAWLNLDAGWYGSIREHGYRFDPAAPSNTAFFPLFGYLWRWLGVGPIGISVVNATIGCAGHAILFAHFRGQWRTCLLFLSLSLITFYISPFSESLFFLFATLFILGLQKNSTSLTAIGILGAGVTRFVGAIFVPALLLMALDAMLAREKQRARKFLLYACWSAAPAVLVFGIQFYQTGRLTAFQETQRFWGTWWRMPNMPFSTWPPQENGLYDQLALFVCLLCIVACGVYAVKRWRGRRPIVEPTLAVAVLYCAGLAVLMLFTKGGLFNSINRYVFATPFLWPLMLWLEKTRLLRKHYIVAGVLAIPYFLVCWHMGISARRLLWMAGLLSLIIGVPLLLQQRRRASLVWTIGMALFLLYIQAHLFFRFLTGVWVG